MLKSLKEIKLKHLYNIQLKKYCSSFPKCIILGIETSCDDTGCAIVDNNGNILGESLHSQQITHLNHGGIIPPIAQELHRNNIERVVDEAISSARIDFKDIDALATTVKPGLPLSLVIGMKYGKYLSRLHKKPFIPIHHMEAHALTIRMIDKTVKFPFLVLLISGGNSLLAYVKNVNEFFLMGKSIDDAPGEAFDKTARRMKLRNIREYENLSGGQAIELAARRATDFSEFYFPSILSSYRDCNFSYSGLKNSVLKHIIRQEKLHGLEPDEVIPNVHNLCAGFQLAITRHICHRVQRAMEYLILKNLLPEENKTLVVSGGAACNNFIFNGLSIICKEYGFRAIRPPPKLCTDNGVMIAWNGVERWSTKTGIADDLSKVDIDAKCPLGKNIIQDVTDANIKCKWVKLKELTKLASLSNENNCN